MKQKLKILFGNLLKFLFLFPFFLVNSNPIEAATIEVIRFWDDQNITSNGRSLRTIATFDDALLVNVGIVKIPVDFFNVQLSVNGNFQNSNTALLPQPLDCSIEKSICAKYNNGVFEGFVSGDQGGNAFTKLVDSVSGMDLGRSIFFFNPNLAIYFRGGTNSDSKYDAQSTQITTISTVPLPAALPLFAGGLGLMGLLGWRRKRKAATATA